MNWEMPNPDSHITNSQFSRQLYLFECENGHSWTAMSNTEYGQSEWVYNSDVCVECGEEGEDTTPLDW